MRNTTVIMDEAINCLLKTLGALETEVFITTLLKEPFDYTKWQRKRFANITLDEFSRQAVQYDKEHPFEQNK
ncbi:hypothetical protein AGMMS49938_17030 [Fibrobacterales bacterium]|nr:hypothetical protein AGMMS49938_17030 [Fibrobacterales bacterium]